MNPAKWLEATAQTSPERPCLFTGVTCVTDYTGFAHWAGGFADVLRSHGIESGDRVVIFMTNSVEYLVALYGIWAIGAVAVPVNAKLHPNETSWIVSDAQARLVVTDAIHLADLTEALSQNVPVLSVGSPEFQGASSQLSPVTMQPDDTAWLFYTSGTTGKPKGVMITCANIDSMCACYVEDVDKVDPTDAILYAAPMSHGAGLYNFMHIKAGCRHIVPESGGFAPDEILNLGERAGPISMFAAPTMVRRLVEHARMQGKTGDGLRTIVYAGGPMYEADILDAVRVMGPRFVQIYGQGECPMGITALPRQDVSDRTHADWRARLNSVGRAQSAIGVQIVADDGAPLPAGEVGEIVVRGPTVMKGYWRNRQATADTIRDGWLWTGDMGHMSDDGYVTLQDRSKDVIISGGSNIYPREVEEVLLSDPNVLEAAVIGRPHPEWGEDVVAVIACDPTNPVDAATLDALCLSRIARFKRPKDYIFVSDLPKNNYGKILKTDLRARFGKTP
jgi:long-chain acyl-CoA synthetase